jgi:hypothetical protein
MIIDRAFLDQQLTAVGGAALAAGGPVALFGELPIGHAGRAAPDGQPVWDDESTEPLG